MIIIKNTGKLANDSSNIIQTVSNELPGSKLFFFGMHIGFAPVPKGTGLRWKIDNFQVF